MENEFKAKVVALILRKKAEIALDILGKKYSVKPPNLKVGRVKGSRRSLGVYVLAENTIYISSSDGLGNPRVILHEFYHHLRSISGRHRGTEKHAQRFADDFIESYVRLFKENPELILRDDMLDK